MSGPSSTPQFQNSHTHTSNSALIVTNNNNHNNITDDPNSQSNVPVPNFYYNHPEAEFYSNNDAVVLYDYGDDGVFDDIIVDDDGLEFAVDGGFHILENEVGNQDDAAFFASLPAGYKFAPTDYELIRHYLYNKVHGLRLPRNQILELDLYGESPESIEEKYPREDKRWYVLTPRQKIYLHGQRPSRTARDGFWKATGADTKIFKNHKPAPGEEELGYKRSLVYLRGRRPHGVKTNWIMYEFRLKNAPVHATDDTNQMLLDEWVLCRLYKKPEPKKSPPSKSFRAGRKERSGSGRSSEATTLTQNDKYSKQDAGQNLNKFAATPSHHRCAEDSGAQLATQPSSSYEDARNLTFVPHYPRQTSFPNIPSSQCQSYYLMLKQQQQASSSQMSSAAVVAVDGVMRRQDYQGRYFPYKSSFNNPLLEAANCGGIDGIMRREEPYMSHHFTFKSSFTNTTAEAAGVGGDDGVMRREDYTGHQYLPHTSSFINPLVADDCDEIDNMILSSPGTAQPYQVDPSFPSSNFQVESLLQSRSPGGVEARK